MSHTTRHGNKYSDQEWADMQAYFKAEEVREEKVSAKKAGLTKHLRSQLKGEGLNQKQADYVVRLFRYGNWIEANVQFSSEGRKIKLNDLWRRWDVAMDKLYKEDLDLQDQSENIRLKIMEGEEA